MTLHELRDWLGFLNVLLVPLVGYAMSINAKLATMRAEIDAHDTLDIERFKAIEARVLRLEGQADHG